jgi:hypothetical protein
MHKLLVWSAILSISIILCGGIECFAQDNAQNVNVTIKPSETIEEKVANESKAKDLRKADEEIRAAKEAARITASSPRAKLAAVRIVYIDSDTSFFNSDQLQNELHKKPEFENGEIVIIDGYDNQKSADALIRIDKTLFTWTYTYKITDRATGMILATGKMNAWDGNAAAPMLAERIIKDIRAARAGMQRSRAAATKLGNR